MYYNELLLLTASTSSTFIFETRLDKRNYKINIHKLIIIIIYYIYYNNLFLSTSLTSILETRLDSCRYK